MIILKIIMLIALFSLCVLAVYIFDKIFKKEYNIISFKEAMELTELPIITFYNKQEKLNFLLDTGSNVSYINESVTKNLSYESTNKKMDTIGMGGTKISTQICKMAIKYKNQQFDEEFNIVDLEDAFSIIKQESGVQIHGILGSKFFEKYKYILDFKHLVAYIK